METVDKFYQQVCTLIFKEWKFAHLKDYENVDRNLKKQINCMCSSYKKT